MTPNVLEIIYHACSTRINGLSVVFLVVIGQILPGTGSSWKYSTHLEIFNEEGIFLSG
jgi:hypothetical protein